MNISYLSYFILQLISTGQADNLNMSIIVLDSGSDSIRAGFVGDESPRVIFTPVVGRPKKQDKWIRDTYVGAKAENLSQYLDLSFPVENGTIKNWEDMEVLWNFTFIKSMHVSQEEHPILLTELPMNPRENRQKMAEIMFDVFNIPALYIANQAFLALYATNRTTGVVLYSGYDVTYSVPIFEGQVISPAVLTLDVGWRDLNHFLMEMLNNTFISTGKSTILDDIKDKLCYVALDFEQEMQGSNFSLSLEKSYELPDGSIVKLRNERFRCPEALFKPSLIGKNNVGIHKVLYDSMMKCNTRQRAKLFSNIVLAGRSTSFPGIGARMQKEVTALAPTTMYVKVIAPPLRQDLTWIGGLKFASQQSFTRKMIKKDNYKKFGPSIIN